MLGDWLCCVVGRYPLDVFGIEQEDPVILIGRPDLAQPRLNPFPRIHVTRRIKIPLHTLGKVLVPEKDSGIRESFLSPLHDLGNFQLRNGGKLTLDLGAEAFLIIPLVEAACHNDARGQKDEHQDEPIRNARGRFGPFAERPGLRPRQSQHRYPQSHEGYAGSRRGRDEGSGIEQRISIEIGQEQQGGHRGQDARETHSSYGSPRPAEGGGQRGQKRQTGEQKAERRHRGHVPDRRFARSVHDREPEVLNIKMDPLDGQEEEQQCHQHARGVDRHPCPIRSAAQRRAGAEDGRNSIKHEQHRRAGRHRNLARPQAGQKRNLEAPSKQSDEPGARSQCAADADQPAVKDLFYGQVRTATEKMHQGLRVINKHDPNSHIIPLHNLTLQPAVVNSTLSIRTLDTVHVLC